MLNIEQFRVFKPLRSYNWDIQFLTGTVPPDPFIIQSVQFPSYELVARTVDQGNLSFSIAADYNLGNLNIAAYDNDKAEVYDWMHEWMKEVINDRLEVTPPMKCSREVKIMELGLKKEIIKEYIMLVQPIGPLEIDKNFDSSDGVIRNLSFSIIGVVR